MWRKKSNENFKHTDSTQSAEAYSPVTNANDFFTFREGIVENAVKECADELLNSEIDGPLVDVFLLTE